MKILLDTANVEEIKKYNEYYDILGVTSNPTILSKEKGDFFSILEEIRKIIQDKELHVQVVESSCEGMIREAEKITSILGKNTYIKVPTNEEGIKTIKILKKNNYKVTATAIYMPQQAMLAATVGADYVAPYFNRMNNNNVNAKEAIREIAALYQMFQCSTKILAASFKNTQQIMDAFLVGAHTVTATPELYTQMVENPMIDGAICGFRKDWVDTYGERAIYEL